MSVRRLEHIRGFHIDRSPRRLENLDTDIAPPEAAMAATRAAIGEDEANSWLPFTGRDDLKEAVAPTSSVAGGRAMTGAGRS